MPGCKVKTKAPGRNLSIRTGQSAGGRDAVARLQRYNVARADLDAGFTAPDTDPVNGGGE